MRSLRGALVAVGGTLAVVYLVAGATVTGAEPVAGAGEMSIGILELIWLSLVWRRPTRGRLDAGVVLQAGLVLLWGVSRTVGLPGVGRLAAGEFDARCGVDAVATGALAWVLRGDRLALRARLLGCQVAALLAGATVYLAMVSLMAMTSPRTIAFGAWLHGQAGGHVFCHLL